MKENWDECFAMVIKSEGGFVNHPKDPGGMTNLGVTRSAWEAFINRKVTEDEMRALTPELVKPFYKALYWDRLKGDVLPDGVDYAAYDFAVNSGIQTAIRKLQAAIGAADDGHWGPASAAALAAMDVNDVLMRFMAQRLRFWVKCSAWPTMGGGWANRAAADLEYASQDN